MNIIKKIKASSSRRRLDEVSGPLTGRIIIFSNDLSVRLEARLGEGGFATIYRGIDATSGQAYAVKAFVMDDDPEKERDLHTEAAIMGALRGHPHVLGLRSSWAGKREAFLLVDLCQGNLANYIIERYETDGKGGFDDEEVLEIFVSVGEAVASVHELQPPMVHRDVKAENVLYRPATNSWVLCDFGSASPVIKNLNTAGEIGREEERVRKQTTPAYRPPELWDLYAREPLGLAIDAWSLGVLLYLLSYGKFPFDPDSKLQILNGRYTIPQGRPKQIEDLIAALLVVDPRQRMSVSTAVVNATMALSELISNTSINDAAAMEDSQESKWRANFDDDAAVLASNTSRTTPLAINSGIDPAGSSGEGWATFETSSDRDQRSQEISDQNQCLNMRNVSANRAIDDAWDKAIHVGSARNGSRGGSSLSTGCDISRRTTEGSLLSNEAPTSPLGDLANHGELHEHCKVLEQLLEDRTQEVSTLRKELRDHLRTSQERIEALQMENRNLHHEMSLLQIQTAATKDYESEILILKADLAAAEQKLKEFEKAKPANIQHESHLQRSLSSRVPGIDVKLSDPHSGRKAPFLKSRSSLQKVATQENESSESGSGGVISHPVPNIVAEGFHRLNIEQRDSSPMKSRSQQSHRQSRMMSSEPGSTVKQRSRRGGWSSAEDAVFDELDPLGGK